MRVAKTRLFCFFFLLRSLHSLHGARDHKNGVNTVQCAVGVNILGLFPSRNTVIELRQCSFRIRSVFIMRRIF